MKTKITIITFLFVLLNSTFIMLNSYSQWEPEVRFTNADGLSSTSENNAWCIATNKNVVHVVWQEYNDDDWNIYYKRSTDDGLNWGANTRLTNETSISVGVSIAVSGLNVHVVWQDNRDGNREIYYKHSTDGGITWGADTRLTNNADNSISTSIAVSSSIVHVVWCDDRDGNREIYYKRSTDSGVNWERDTRLTNNTAESTSSCIAVSGLNVHVVWQDIRDGNWEIYYESSTDGGSNWGEDTRLTNDTASSFNPSIAVFDSNVHIVWYAKKSNFGNEIYYKHSTNSGINWEAGINLTNSHSIGSHSVAPSIACSTTNVHIVWTDTRNSNWEIYYKCSTNNGTQWEIDIRLTNKIVNSWYPFIAFSGSTVHVVWKDESKGNEEIYYKRNPTGNIEEVSHNNNYKSKIYWSNVLIDAQKAFTEGKYLLVLELLKDFPSDDPQYFEAVTLMQQALEKLPRNSNQNFVTVSGRINCGCNKTINGYVVFEDINTRLNVGRCGITSDGYYCIVLPTGKTYSYYIDSKDFYPISRVIDFTSPNQTLNHKDDITLVSYEDMKEKQTSVRINNHLCPKEIGNPNKMLKTTYF